MTALRQPANVTPLAVTIGDYLAQLSVSLRPQSVLSYRSDLQLFAAFIAERYPDVIGAGDLQRSHVEAFKAHLAASPGAKAPRLATATIRRRLSTLRMFFERIAEWGWADAPSRTLLFAGDLPKRDEALPKFLDDAAFAAFMRAARNEPRPLLRLAIELLGRTGMRVGELCELAAAAVVPIGAT